MFVHRVYPDSVIQAAILAAADAFYQNVNRLTVQYNTNAGQYIETVRRIESEEILL